MTGWRRVFMLRAVYVPYITDMFLTGVYTDYHDRRRGYIPASGSLFCRLRRRIPEKRLLVEPSAPFTLSARYLAICSSSSLIFLRRNSFSFWLRDISWWTTAYPSSTTLQISATAALARTSMMEAIWEWKSMAVDIVNTRPLSRRDVYFPKNNYGSSTSVAVLTEMHNLLSV